MLATTGDILLQDIIANPADDGLRLVYADWCEDVGDHVQAKFIRMQIKMSKLSCTNPRKEIQQEGKKLLITLGKKTCPCEYCILEETYVSGSMDKIPMWRDINNWTFVRGFIEEISIYPPNWLEHGKFLVANCPLTTVHLRHWELNSHLRSGKPQWRYKRKFPGTKLFPDEFIPVAKRIYPTREAALAAASEAALHWARDQ